MPGAGRIAKRVGVRAAIQHTVSALPRPVPEEGGLGDTEGAHAVARAETGEQGIHKVRRVVEVPCDKLQLL